MIAVNITLAFLMIGTILAASFWALKSRRSFTLNQRVAVDLETIITNTLDIVSKSSQTQSKHIRGTTLTSVPPEELNLDSVETLSTLITVLINRFGDVRLAMGDFMISDTEYVSVYVDTASQEIILSMNHDMTESADYTVVNYGNSDDTFH